MGGHGHPTRKWLEFPCHFAICGLRVFLGSSKLSERDTQFLVGGEGDIFSCPRFLLVGWCQTSSLKGPFKLADVLKGTTNVTHVGVS